MFSWLLVLILSVSHLCLSRKDLEAYEQNKAVECIVFISCFPGSSDGKESINNGGDSGLTPGSGRSPGEGNGYPLQYSCLENSMDRGAWQSTAHGIAKSWTRLSD